MKQTMNNDYATFRSKMGKVSDIGYAAALMEWDQEVYMPSRGANFRAQQLSTLSGLLHEQFVNNDMEEILLRLSTDRSLNEKEKRNVAETRKAYERKKKYSTEFVIALSRATSEAFQAWSKARPANDFGIFAPKLEKLVELKRKEAGIIGYKDHPYNALLDLYEPGATVAELDVLFKEVKEKLVPFVKNIFLKPKPDAAFLFKNYDKQKQWDFGIELLNQMHYNFDSGRQDVSAHPFTISFSAEDVRVTTRINTNDIREMIWSCIHEGGHALYEQGIPPGEYGLPSGEAVSLGIHESQSRLWENNVGRSLAYWKANYRRLQEYFPDQLGAVTLEQFYKSINVVEPSLIRTAADELTYHFHILIRYEIEKALIEGSVEVKDLAALWNKKYKDYLNVEVPSDAKGVMQDVHWSHGSFGYFPTYSLGSFYAAQFFAKASKELPGLDHQIEKGELNHLLDWLRKNIHQHGKTYQASELCERVTGEPLRFAWFMKYAEAKYSGIYG